MKIEYVVTQLRTVHVASGTADGAIAVALAQGPEAWTVKSLEAIYVGSAGYAAMPGNEPNPASEELAAWN